MVGYGQEPRGALSTARLVLWRLAPMLLVLPSRIGVYVCEAWAYADDAMVSSGWL